MVGKRRRGWFLGMTLNVADDVGGPVVSDNVGDNSLIVDCRLVGALCWMKWLEDNKNVVVVVTAVAAVQQTK
jgi:hypothetical protein